jgi:transposase
MQVIADRPEAPSAIRSDLGAIFDSMELSRSSWVITSLSPGGGEKMSKHSVPAADICPLLTRFSSLKQKASARTGNLFPIVVIQEAGLEPEYRPSSSAVLLRTGRFVAVCVGARVSASSAVAWTSP